ncbi:hypothetical protein ACFWZ4_13075 [Frateuria sp. GZRe12]|uniref:hypothetical protein n=1 Tax=Frateuria sp. GZRe12 TaxID=3351533 RepID=UPI003EDC6EFE
MDTSLFTAAVSAALGLITAALASLLIKKLRAKERRFVAVQSAGKREEITAPSNASLYDIQTIALKSFALEQQVGDILRSLSSIGNVVEIRPSRAVDFIATQGDKKVAVEVKANPRGIDVSQIERYLTAEPDIDSVIIASLAPLPRQLEIALSKQLRSGRVRFVNISGELAEDRSRVQAELAASFHRQGV